MPIYAKAGEKKWYPPAPAGMQQGVCVDVIDMGLKPNQFKGGELQHKVRIVFQLGDDEKRDDGKRHIVSRQFSLSLHEKATLRRMLESWRGRKFTDADMKGDGFDLETLIGANALLSITHGTSQTDPTKVFANIDTISPLLKGMTKLKADGYERKVEAPTETPDAADPVDADDISF